MFHMVVLSLMLAILAAIVFQRSEVSLFVRTFFFFFTVFCVCFLCWSPLCWSFYYLFVSVYLLICSLLVRPQTLKSFNQSLSCSVMIALTWLLYFMNLNFPWLLASRHAPLHILSAPHFLGCSRFPNNCKTPAPYVPGSSPVADSE